MYKHKHSPSNPNRLLHLQRCYQGFPVDRRDLIDTKPCAHQQQCRVKFFARRIGNVHEAVLVYIVAVIRGIYSQA